MSGSLITSCCGLGLLNIVLSRSVTYGCGTYLAISTVRDAKAKMRGACPALKLLLI
jgi:hypothetical protein